jgi:hypothetical protein
MLSHFLMGHALESVRPVASETPRLYWFKRTRWR